jgi:hypothetical protein
MGIVPIVNIESSEAEAVADDVASLASDGACGGLEHHI